MSFTVFHQIERYYVASQVIQRMRGELSSCRILEVGAGRHTNLLRYFPQDEILFSDIIYTPEELQDSCFTYADATQLPFKDDAFDYVISLDVLEHIPAHLRKLMLQETYRVARRGVFLSFPHNSAHPSIGDELEAIYRFFQKEPPVWLHEHDEMGLPQFSDIQKEALRIASPSSFYTAHAVDYELNRIMLRLEAYTSCNPSLNDFFVQVNNCYTQSILQHDLGTVLEDAVKSYIVLSKEPIAPEIREKLDFFFAQYDQKLINQFRIQVVGGLRQWIADQFAHKKEGIAHMETQNMMIVMLEMVDRLDQVLERIDQHQIQQNRQIETLVQEQEHLVQALQAANVFTPITALAESVARQETVQMKMIEEMKNELQRQREAQEKIVLNVILITYNQEDYIRETLQSILDQKTDFRFNIIVADDCSKDKTVSIIRSMEAKTDIPFIYLDNTYNRGIMQNYKRAFAACDAEYVAIMEGDDIWVDPYRLQKHKRFLESHPECAMSFNQFIVKDFKKGFEKVQPAIAHEKHDTYCLFTGHDLAYDNLIGNFSTCVYKNAYLQKLPQQLYDVHAYDWLTNIFVSQMGHIGCLLQPMSIYRIHSGGTWSQKKQSEKLQEMIDAILVYDKLTNQEFTLGFTAHRQRLEEQLCRIEYQKNPSTPNGPAHAHELAPISETPPALVKSGKSCRRFVKRILLKLRAILLRILDCLPPIVTIVLKYLVPPRIVRKIKNMKAE